MMTEEKSKQQKLMILTMENLMPQDHFLRRLEENLNLDFVYDIVRPLYGNRVRPSVDPVILVKMLLIGYLYGVTGKLKGAKYGK